MTDQPHYPQQVPIEAYGNGGFRFADMSHIGSLLCVPSGVYAWSVQNMDTLSFEDFERVFKEADALEFLLLGTGKKQIFPTPEIKHLFDEANMGLDAMDTGAAARTYNVLLAEKRNVAAALISVE
ncbi:MAG: Mth938-like domain-containing protein [Pseudomonadota bacterium]